MSNRITFFGINLKPGINLFLKYKVIISLAILLLITFFLFLPSLTLSQLEPGLREFYQDNNNQTYMYELDPYHYLLQAENSTAVDSYHVYFILAFQKITNLELTQSMIYYSFFLILLLVLVTFFFLNRISNTYSAVIGSLFFIALLGSSGRLFVGFNDTDPYNILFPLVIFWLIYESLSDKKHYLSSYYLITISGLLMGVYSKVWHGWWFFFHLFWISLLLFIFYLFFKENIENSSDRITQEGNSNIHNSDKQSNLIFGIMDKLAKSESIIFVLFLFSSIASILYFNSLSTLKEVFSAPIPAGYGQILGSINIWYGLIMILILMILVYGIWKYFPERILNHAFYQKQQKLVKVLVLILFFSVSFILPLIISSLQSRTETILPNTFNYVGELIQTPFLTLVSIFGGMFLFILIWCGYFCFSLEEKEKEQFFLNVLFILWLIGALSATLLARRFIIIALLPLAVGFTLLVQSLRKAVLNATFLEMDKDIVLNFIILPILLLLLISPYAGAKERINNNLPQINDNFIAVFNYLQKNTSTNSFVSSWWDYGYPLQALAQREVIFNGGLQNTPAAYWVGKAFTTSDQDLSRNIFNMLACENDAYLSKIKNVLNYDLQGVQLLEQILSLNKSQAKVFLGEKLTPSQIDALLELTHCELKRENYVLITNKMLYFDSIYKFGLWNFSKAEQCLNLKQAGKLKEESCDEFMFSDQLGFSLWQECKNITVGVYDCHNIKINYEPSKMQIKNITIYQNNTINIPHYFKGRINGKFVEKEFLNYSSDLVVYFFAEGNTTYAFTSSPELKDSILVKLFLFSEQKLVNFQKVYATPFRYWNKIVVYRLK